MNTIKTPQEHTLSIPLSPFSTPMKLVTICGIIINEASLSQVVPPKYVSLVHFFNQNVDILYTKAGLHNCKK
jgi:hypothetical protein